MRSLSNTMKALSHLEVCWLLDGMTLGNPKSKPNLGLRQLLQRDHGGGDGHHHPLGGAGLLVDVVQGGTGGDGGQESGEGEQVHLHPVDDVTTHQSLSFSLKSNRHVARLLIWKIWNCFFSRSNHFGCMQKNNHPQPQMKMGVFAHQCSAVHWLV